MFHHITGDVSVSRRRVTINGFRLGEGLEAEFAAKAVLCRAIPFKGLFAVPHVPEMRIAPIGIVEILPVAAG